LLCTPVVAGDDGDPYLSPFGLILTRSFLVTVRFNEAPIVDAVSNRFFSYRITTASLDSSRGSKTPLCLALAASWNFRAEPHCGGGA
jgi:hypothetical protein